MRPLRLLFCACWLTSCAGLPPLAKQQLLVGHWRYTNQSQSCDLEFRKDGKFTATIRQGRETLSELGGRWSLQGDLLLYKYELGSGESGEGNTDQDQLLALAKDYYVIRAGDGSERRYVRVE